MVPTPSATSSRTNSPTVFSPSILGLVIVGLVAAHPSAGEISGPRSRPACERGFLINICASTQARPSRGLRRHQRRRCPPTRERLWTHYQDRLDRHRSGGRNDRRRAIAAALAVADRIEQGTAGGTVSIGYPGFLGIELAQTTQFDPGVVPQAATVAGVIDGSPAAASGITSGSTITSLGGVSITSATSLATAVARHHPEQSVRVSWTDSAGAGHTADVKLAAGPNS
ncbi:MAG: PDZ domain-containing protein [Aeromicrobium sp.]